MLRRLLAALLLTSTAAYISDCDTTSIFRPTELALSPDPPALGQPVTMTVKFDNPGPVVTDGTVTTSVTLNFIPFAPSEEPLCDNTACPIVTGANDRSTTSTWPDNVQGTVVTKSVWTGSSGESLLCVQTKVSVGALKGLRGSLANLTETPRLFADDLSLKQMMPYGLFDNGTCPVV